MVLWRKRQENFKEGNAIKHISLKTLKRVLWLLFSIKLLFSQVVLIFGETLFTCFTWNDIMPSISKNQGVFKINVFSHCFPIKRKSSYDFVVTAWFLMWTSLGLNQGPPDYESVALTNWATSPANIATHYVWNFGCKDTNFVAKRQIFHKKICAYKCFLYFCK